MKTKTSMAVWSLAALLGFVLLAGCGKKEEEQPAAAPTATPTAAATPIDPATAASISGTVKLDGEAPKAAKIDMSQDPACKGTNTAENVVAPSGAATSRTFSSMSKRASATAPSTFPRLPSRSTKAAANIIPTSWA